MRKRLPRMKPLKGSGLRNLQRQQALWRQKPKSKAEKTFVTVASTKVSVCVMVSHIRATFVILQVADIFSIQINRIIGNASPKIFYVCLATVPKKKSKAALTYAKQWVVFRTGHINKHAHATGPIQQATCYRQRNSNNGIPRNLHCFNPSSVARYAGSTGNERFFILTQRIIG